MEQFPVFLTLIMATKGPTLHPRGDGAGGDMSVIDLMRLFVFLGVFWAACAAFTVLLMWLGGVVAEGVVERGETGSRRRRHGRAGASLKRLPGKHRVRPREFRVFQSVKRNPRASLGMD
jgi:hypothetical protein